MWQASHWARNLPCCNSRQHAVQGVEKQYTKEIDCQALPRQCMQVLHYSCFTEKSVRYTWPEGQKWILQHHRGTLCDCPGILQPL